MTSPLQIPDPRWLEWLAVLGRVVNSARLVTAFDGTDRQSLDQLRDALYEFGIIDEELSRSEQDEA
jgi:hypothetical protein